MKKIGKAFDPLFTHPYYHAIIKVKEQENKSTAHIEEHARNLGATKFSTINNLNSKITDKNISTKNTSLSNYSSAQTNIILTPPHDSKTSTTPNTNSKILKISPTQENFVLPEKSARGINRQVAHGSTFDSHWSNDIRRHAPQDPSDRNSSSRCL